jgi:hypothetical protein
MPDATAQDLSWGAIGLSLAGGFVQYIVARIQSGKITEAAQSVSPDLLRRVDRLEDVAEEDRAEHGKLIEKINVLDNKLSGKISELDVKQSASQAQLSAQLGGLESSVGRIDGTLETILKLMIHKGEGKP